MLFEYCTKVYKTFAYLHNSLEDKGFPELSCAAMLVL